MKTDREVMQQALEALEYMHKEKCDYMRRNSLGDPLGEDAARLALPAITALRARLAEPETCKPALQVKRADPRRPLTDEEIHFIARHECFLDIDAGKAVELFARAIELAHKIGGNDD